MENVDQKFNIDTVLASIYSTRVLNTEHLLDEANYTQKQDSLRRVSIVIA